MGRHSQSSNYGDRRSNTAKPKFKQPVFCTMINCSDTTVSSRRRYRPTYIDIAEIQRCQKATENMIPRLSFQRQVREIVKAMGIKFRFQGAALSALQESSEAYLIGLFADVNLVATHGKRKGIQTKDLQLAMKIRGDLKVF